MYTFLIVIELLCTALWTFYGFRDENRFDFVIAALWLEAALFNTVMSWRQNKKKRQEKKQMVKHIVLYTFKEGVDKAEAVKIVASVLELLVGKIPGLLKMEIRQAYNGMDYALYSEFESKEALNAYATHPLHQEAKTHFFHLLDSRVAADYEV